ncbi:hypothetical protein NW759_016209 [Fusarium solani]|nr:hypothetical protein NW759_016209 [Fusarium solani]
MAFIPPRSRGLAHELGHAPPDSRTFTLPCLTVQLAPEGPDVNPPVIPDPTSLVDSEPAVPNLETHEQVSAQHIDNEFQPEQPVDMHVNEADQALTDHLSDADGPTGSLEVIYISDDPLEDSGGGVDEYASSAVPSQNVSETAEYVDPEHGVIRHLRRLNSLPIESAPAFARMFCLDPSSITPKTWKRLLGTRPPLRLPQLVYLFHVVTRERDHSDLRDHYLTDTMPSGKTIATWAFMVLTRTIQLIVVHVRKNPHLHCRSNTNEGHSRRPARRRFRCPLPLRA